MHVGDELITLFASFYFHLVHAFAYNDGKSVIHILCSS